MNKLYFKIIILFSIWSSFVSAESGIFTGGISLEKTAFLAKQSIALPDGNPEPILALAMRHGKAQGYFSDKAAAAIKQRYGKAIPIFVSAERLERMKGQPECHKVKLVFSTSSEFVNIAPAQTIETAVCAKRSSK